MTIDCKVTTLYGSLELCEYNALVDGRLVWYSYSITRDREGREISRSDPAPLSSIGWDDGSPFTAQDLEKLQ